jgi:uncharacterized ferritin-like protein (DUF455 family)
VSVAPPCLLDATLADCKALSLVDALANIEQWAIDLAWDVIARFAMTSIDGRTLPDEFYLGMLSCSLSHFSLIV